jgi:ankyrin repeat protein
MVASLLSLSTLAADSFEEAVLNNEITAIRQFLADADDIDVRGTNGKTALMIAAREGNLGLVSQLLQNGADANAANINGGTPIMFAAISGNTGVIRALLDSGANINSRGSNGWNALMVSAAKGHEPATRMILDAGAEINSTDVYLWTALHRAVFENRITVTRALLEYSSLDIHRQDEHGATALHLAAAEGHSEIVELLISAGANPSFPDLSGRTAAVYASDRGHALLARILKDAG